MKHGPFDSMFDFDNDDKLGSFERSVQIQFLDDISRDSSLTAMRDATLGTKIYSTT